MSSLLLQEHQSRRWEQTECSLYSPQEYEGSLQELQRKVVTCKGKGGQDKDKGKSKAFATKAGPEQIAALTITAFVRRFDR